MVRLPWKKYTIVFGCKVIIKGGGEVEGVPDFFYCPILHPDSDRKRIQLTRIEHILWSVSYFLTRTKLYVKHCSYNYPNFDRKKITLPLLFLQVFQLQFNLIEVCCKQEFRGAAPTQKNLIIFTLPIVFPPYYIARKHQSFNSFIALNSTPHV